MRINHRSEPAGRGNGSFLLEICRKTGINNIHKFDLTGSTINCPRELHGLNLREDYIIVLFDFYVRSTRLT